mmetsp:Transcript_14062/g.21914  ORF Transcript_14062/g.21914 Transcript_14062/m.21914 type:complete len:267 (-) Transcript_14062:1681-2481(-)
MRRLGALAVVVPAPGKHLALAVHHQGVGLASGEAHNGRVREDALGHRLDPLRGPRVLVDLGHVDEQAEVDYPGEEMDLLDGIRGHRLEQAHLLGLGAAPIVAVELGELHSFDVLQHLQLLGQVGIEPDFDLVSSGHVATVGLLQDESVLTDDRENTTGPSHAESRLNQGDFTLDVSEAPPHNEALDLLLDLLGRHVLFQLDLASDSSEHEVFLASSLHVASEDSLDLVDGLGLLLLLRDAEGTVENLHDTATAYPHLTRPIDRSQV